MRQEKKQEKRLQEIERSRKKALENGYTEREWARINALDAQEHRHNLRLGLILVMVALLALFLAYSVWYVMLRSHDYTLSLSFDHSSSVYGFTDISSDSGKTDGFASSLCVYDESVPSDSVYVTALSTGLFDLTAQEILYGSDMFTERSEASLTKIMTALVTLKYGNLDDVVTVTDTALDIEYDSSVCEIHPGDVLTLRQLLYGMLIASGNDAAQMIAEHVGGSVSNFVDMMNQEAKALGATHTSFANPSGLTQEGHYTCIYDLYLMFNEALKYDTFQDIISRENYYAEYTDSAGNTTSKTWETTNHYFTGEADLPEDVIVYGGKTGTTEDAGACLCLLTKNLYGDPFIAIILHSQDKDQLYVDMTQILTLIP